MARDLEPELARPRRIVDLYCGAGTFSLYFARHGCDVFGIEESAQAVDEAAANAALNGLAERVSFRTGRVEEIAGSDEGRAALAGAAGRRAGRWLEALRRDSRPRTPGRRRADRR